MRHSDSAQAEQNYTTKIFRNCTLGLCLFRGLNYKEGVGRKMITFNNFFFFRKSCRLWNNVGKYCRVRQATDDNVAHAHWMRILKTTNTHSKFIIFNAFWRQQLLHERATMLRCTHTVCLANRSAQFLNAGDRTVTRSPLCCHIPSAFQFNIRHSFYHAQYGICGGYIPQNTRGKPQFEPATHGLLQTEKIFSMSTCVHGWPPPKSSTSDTGLHAMFNYIRYTQLGYSKRRSLENGHFSRRSANWHSGHMLRLSTSCTHTSSHADTMTVTGSWKRNGKFLIFALQAKKTLTLSRTRTRKQTKQLNGSSNTKGR
jgi:hypothetical protein